MTRPRRTEVLHLVRILRDPMRLKRFGPFRYTPKSATRNLSFSERAPMVSRGCLCTYQRVWVKQHPRSKRRQVATAARISNTIATGRLDQSATPRHPGPGPQRPSRQDSNVIVHCANPPAPYRHPSNVRGSVPPPLGPRPRGRRRPVHGRAVTRVDHTFSGIRDATCCMQVRVCPHHTCADKGFRIL